MFTYIKNVFKIKSTYVLLLLSLFSIALSIMRLAYTDTGFYLFLFWNLFLAFIPWFIASILYVNKIRNKFAITVLTFIWLLFFPNAPYILTDIIHLGIGKNAPLWFDLILLLSYSFTGMLYGFVSLYMIENKLSLLLKRRTYGIIPIFLIYLSCFGVYLGRFLRWNSWDIISNISGLFIDIKNRIINPFQYETTWGFTILFGTLLNGIYFSYKTFISYKEDNVIQK